VQVKLLLQIKQNVLIRPDTVLTFSNLLIFFTQKLPFTPYIFTGFCC